MVEGGRRGREEERREKREARRQGVAAPASTRGTRSQEEGSTLNALTAVPGQVHSGPICE